MGQRKGTVESLVVARRFLSARVDRVEKTGAKSPIMAGLWREASGSFSVGETGCRETMKNIRSACI